MNVIDNDLKPTHRAALMSLFTSAGTLICCALPALLVAIGAGAALSSLIATVPQLVWFSEHKIAIFITAGIMLVISGALQWRSRRLPCPADPAQARACTQLRRKSLALYFLSVGIFAIGAFFAFLAPLVLR